MTLIGPCAFAAWPAAAQSDTSVAAASEVPDKVKKPKRLPQNTKDLDGRVVIAIDPATGDITPYVEKNPAEVTIPEGVDIKSIVSLPGSDYVILTYEASPQKTLLCRWVGSTYTCYEV
ncbi:MAG TPA: hypothetical protein VFZ01_09670 [Geminicoccaceae bacterium]